MFVDQAVAAGDSDDLTSPVFQEKVHDFSKGCDAVQAAKRTFRKVCYDVKSWFEVGDAEASIGVDAVQILPGNPACERENESVLTNIGCDF